MFRRHLTLRGLSLFFKILPISNAGDSAAYILATVRFFYPKLFRHGVLLLPTCLPGLESPQALHRIKSNAVLSLFWLELGQTKWPHCMLGPAIPMFAGFQQGKCLSYPPDCMDRLNETQICVGSKRLHPFQPPLTGGYPLLKFPHTHYSGQRAAEKPSTFYQFSWVCPWHQL